MHWLGVSVRAMCFYKKSKKIKAGRTGRDYVTLPDLLQNLAGRARQKQNRLLIQPGRCRRRTSITISKRSRPLLLLYTRVPIPSGRARPLLLLHYRQSQSAVDQILPRTVDQQMQVLLLFELISHFSLRDLHL